MPNELTTPNMLEKGLAEIETIEDGVAVTKQAKALTQAAKKFGLSKDKVCDVVWIHIQAALKVGELLGKNPGKAHGQAYPGKKARPHGPALKDFDVKKFRAVAWRAGWEMLERYFGPDGWAKKYSEVHPSFNEALIISRLGDLQEPVMKLLEGRFADSLQEAIKMTRQNEMEESPPPEGLYRTIIIDPPWPIKNISRDVAPRQEGFSYETMSVEEISEMGVPADEHCHCWLWTTQKFLPEAFKILEAWDFKYIFTMVWHKNGGFQPVKLPQYNCEFVLFGRRGGLEFLDTKDFFTCFDGKRREHSRKPENFYDLVRRVSPEPRINMFTREPVEGFEGWGNESEKF